jgi:hypothetical protein
MELALEETKKKTKEMREGPRKRYRKKKGICIGGFPLKSEVEVLIPPRMVSQLAIGESAVDFPERATTNSPIANWEHWYETIRGRINTSTSLVNEETFRTSPEEIRPQIMSLNSRLERWNDINTNDTESKVEMTSIVDDIEDIARVDEERERQERIRWGAWAVAASEIERHRRIYENELLDAEENRERHIRRQWALQAIEQERNERISAQFLTTLASTQWFNETISAYSEDYELVCPYYKLGCRISCRRSTVANHLKECIYAFEIISNDPVDSHDSRQRDGKDGSDASTGTSPSRSPRSNAYLDTTEYEVVCLFAIFGCSFTGTLFEVTEHMLSCSLRGSSDQQEQEERSQLKEHVISECEKERVRQLSNESAPSLESRTLLGEASLLMDKVKKEDRFQDVYYSIHRIIQMQMSQIRQVYKQSIIVCVFTLFL